MAPCQWVPLGWINHFAMDNRIDIYQFHDGRHVVDSCSDIKQDARKNGILLLVLADDRIPRLQVLVDRW
eukprot:scaffold10180_cov304-Chaetoceros_neogracile.AAC.22